MGVRLLGILALVSVLCSVSSWAQCPKLTGISVTPAADLCVGERLDMSVSISGNVFPEAQQVEWWGNTSRESFDRQDPDSRLLATAEIDRITPVQCSTQPSLLAVRWDGLGRDGDVASDPNELVVLWSGSGFDANSLVFDLRFKMGPGTTRRFTGDLSTVRLALR